MTILFFHSAAALTSNSADLPPIPVGDSEPASESPASSFEKFRRLIHERVSAPDVIDLHCGVEPMVLCGTHGELQQDRRSRGRCPQCGGYAMPLSELRLVKKPEPEEDPEN